MADRIPIKVLPLSGDTTALSEFNPTDTIPIALGGTGSSTSAAALIALGAASAIDLSTHLSAPNPHSITPGSIGAIPTTEKGVANGVAPLNALNEIPLIHIPSAAIPEVDVVANAAARLALIPLRQEGDSLYQTDDSSTWKHDGATYLAWTPQEVFGSQHSFAADNTVSVSTSTAFQQKISLTTGPVPAGRYHISWYYQYNSDGTNRDFEARIQHDNIAINVFFQKTEAKDQAGSFGSTGTSQQQQAAGWTIIDLTAISHTFDLDWRTDSGGNEASIWNSRIRVYRIS